jgi:CRISPR-associated protein Csb2
MPSYLCITVRFLDPAFHGRRDGAAPEWPPSPLRLFQALVAAAAARWDQRQRVEYAKPALEWLERQPPPTIVAPPGVEGAAYRLSVPNNALDIVARAWARGNESNKGDASPATHRVLKTVRPTRLPEGSAVHYLWPLPAPTPPAVAEFIATLSAAARSVVALGWGIDLIAADGRLLTREEVDELPGERWRESLDGSAVEYRVPREGTLARLLDRHELFLTRVSLDSRRAVPVPPLTAFRVVGYRRATDVAGRPFAAFAVLRPDASGFRPFDPPRWAAAVAGMVRHAVAKVARRTRPFGWTDADINTFVHGHTPDGTDRVRGEAADRRLAYLPLPTINPLKVESIRRVLVVGPPGSDREINWLVRALAGQELFAQGRAEPVGLMSVIPTSDRNVTSYTRPAVVWSTVTPVVLPGHDDRGDLRRRLGDTRDSDRQRCLLARLERRTDTLIRKAFEQSGMPRELVRAAVLDWREAGFRPGTELARTYVLPPPLTLPRYHVRVRWPVPIRGPLAVGAARYRGLGVFAPEGFG